MSISLIFKIRYSEVVLFWIFFKLSVGNGLCIHKWHTITCIRFLGKKKHACNILGAQNQTIAWQNIKRQLADSRRAQPNKMINNIAAKQHSRRSKSNNNAIFAILVTSNQTIERYYSWENAQQRVTGIAFSSLSNINLRTKQIAVPRRKCPN